MNLRIALVTEYYYPHLGGICEHVHFFAREARSRGHAVDIITSSLPGAGDREHVIRIGRSVPVYFNGSQARLTVGRGLRREMRSVLVAGGYDVVHVHSPLTPTLPLLAIEESPAPVVGTFHTYFDRSWNYRALRGYFQRRLDMLSAAIAVSQSTIVALERYFDADWRIVPNGVDTDLFHPDAPAPREIRSEAPAILFLGRFDPRNGLSTLMEAFKRVRARGRRAQLIIVGDGALRGYYRRRAEGGRDIIFAGAVLDGRPGFYANSAIYACPTTKASFGITLLEAMACGTPIVCSDILGFRDVVKHGREALMVPSGDRDALANALVRLLDDAELRARLGERGRQCALQYDWQHVATRILDVYREVLETSRLAAAV